METRYLRILIKAWNDIKATFNSHCDNRRVGRPPMETRYPRSRSEICQRNLKKLCVRPRLFNIQNTREETLFPWSGRYLGAIGRKNLGDFKQGARKGPGIRRCRKQKYL